MLPILLASYRRLLFTWIILNLLSRYLWRKSFFLIPLQTFSSSLTRSTRCWLLNASWDSAKMLVWQQQQTKEILILIRCPFCSAHKINACILSLNFTYFYCFSHSPFLPSFPHLSHLLLFFGDVMVMHSSIKIKSRELSDHWTSIKIDCVHQLLFGCGKILNENFIHPIETRDPCLLAIIALWRLRRVCRNPHVITLNSRIIVS